MKRKLSKRTARKALRGGHKSVKISNGGRFKKVVEPTWTSPSTLFKGDKVVRKIWDPRGVRMRKVVKTDDGSGRPKEAVHSYDIRGDLRHKSVTVEDKGKITTKETPYHPPGRLRRLFGLRGRKSDKTTKYTYRP